MSKIIRCLLALLHLGNNVYSLTIQTDEFVSISHEDNSIILNCTYQIDSNEKILDKKIRWQKWDGRGFKDLAMFSTPGGFPPNIVGELKDIYINRTELIQPNTTHAAVMVIKDSVCSDMGKYQCWIEYYDSEFSEKEESSPSTVLFDAKATGPKEFVVFPNEVEENQPIRLTCTADVGRPRGYIQISKISQNSDALEIIYTSKSPQRKTENCTEFVNITYNVTRDDNGSFFRCSSKNNLTQEPELSKDSSKISVTYGPDKSSITLTPNKSIYNVGESLTIQFIIDSNPSPVLIWRFRPPKTSSANLIELSHDKSKLVFDSLQTTDSGTYICTGVNKGGSNSPNATSHVSVFVRQYRGCNQCRITEICRQNDDYIICETNRWVPTAVVFMILSVIFASSCLASLRYRKESQETIASEHLVHSARHHPYNTTEDNGGEYSSPSDLNRMREEMFNRKAGSPTPEDISEAYSKPRDMLKMQEQCSLLPHKHQPDGYTTTEDVVEYAAVQKQATKNSQESVNNLYDSAWNSETRFKTRAHGPLCSPEEQ